MMAATGTLEAVSQMGWFQRFRRRHLPPDGLAAARDDTDRSLRTARERRDNEFRRLREERRTIVQPLREIRQANHFADLATNAFRHHGREG